MTYTTFLGKTYEDEHDEELTRKFGDTYNYFKKEYPGLHKLPTGEVEGIYSEFKKSPYGDTFEKSVDRTKQYINQRMPQWQKQYINPKTQGLSNSNCYITFDGNNLDLYKHGHYDENKLQNGELHKRLSAQSGQDNYQNSQYQNIKNKGPLPEGTYYANQDQRQNMTFSDAMIGTGVKILNGLGIPLNKGKWKGGPISWGIKRIWLQPDSNTETFGRSGFSIHGGLTKGSAGCIDIPWQTDKLSDYLDDCQDSVPVYVKYPKNW